MYSKVYVEITNMCNMNCSFCHKHSRKPKQMTMDEFALVLDKINGQTDYIYYHLMGEPLTHPQLPDFIKLAGKRGYKSIITTNGTLLSKRSNEILSSGVHKINISLHSFENGTYDEHTEYICRLADFAKKAADNGIIIVFRLWNKGFDDGKNEVVSDILKENIEGEWAENTRGIRIRKKIHLEWGEKFEWPDSNAEIKGGKITCYGLKDQFGILSDGTVVPCCLDNNGDIPLGNIFDEELEVILNKEKTKFIKSNFGNGKIVCDLCKTCGFLKRLEGKRSKNKELL